MSNFQRATAHALMLDGTELGPVVVIHADKVRWERTAKVNGWTAEENAQTLNAFITWAALSRAGETDLDYDEFVSQLEAAETRPMVKESENPTS